MKLTNNNDTEINFVGKYSLLYETSKSAKPLVDFQIVNCDHRAPAALWLPTLVDLNLINRVKKSITFHKENMADILKEYSNRFKGIGNFQVFTYGIKPNAEVKVGICVKVPISSMDSLKNVLNKMINSKTIKTNS